MDLVQESHDVYLVLRVEMHKPLQLGNGQCFSATEDRDAGAMGGLLRI